MASTTLATRNHWEIFIGISEFLSGPEGQIVLDLPSLPSLPSMSNVPSLPHGGKYGNARSIQAVGAFAFVFSFVSIVFRIFCRTRPGSKLWWDDGFVIVAMVFAMINQLILNMINHLGSISWLSMIFYGPDKRRLTPAKEDDIILALKLFVAFEAFYILSTWSVKFSMLAYYKRRLASGQNERRSARIYILVLGTLCTFGLVFSIFSLLLSCVPISEFWNIRDLKSQRCHKKKLLTYGTGITAILTDALVILAPLPLFERAKFIARQKLGIAALYLFGAFIFILSVLRMVTHVKVESIQKTLGWSHLEETVALFAANLPMVTKLLISPLIDTPVVELRPLRKRRTFHEVDEKTFHKDLPEVPVTEAVNTQRLSHVAYQIQDPTLLHPDDARRDLQKVRRSEQVKSTVLVKEIQSPDYRRLKIVLNGQSVWEVRPVSVSTSASRPATLYSATSRPTTSRSSVWSSRSSRYSVTSSRYAGSRYADETESEGDIPEMPPIADEWKRYKSQE